MTDEKLRPGFCNLAKVSWQVVNLSTGFKGSLYALIGSKIGGNLVSALTYLLLGTIAKKDSNNLVR